MTAIDCPDPSALADFYAGLLGWTVQPIDPDDADWVEIHGELGQSLAFQQVTDYVAPEWPGSRIPQQMHLDVEVDDLDTAEKATLDLGATKAEHQPGTSFRVFLDPAGHPFCLCQA
jgi:predicted enzyme related to lactoylglutathione lyase